MTPIVLETPEQVVEQYSKMIWRLTWRCLGRMPAHTTYQADDVYQEGVAQMLAAYAEYRRTQPATTAQRPAAPTAQGPQDAQGRRRASLTTYVQVAVMHRYGRLVRTEWQRWGHLMDPYVEVVDEFDNENGGNNGNSPVQVQATGGELGAYEEFFCRECPGYHHGSHGGHVTRWKGRRSAHEVVENLPHARS